MRVQVPARSRDQRACSRVAGVPHGLEGVVHAVAAGQFLDALHWVALGGVDHVGRPELPGPFQLVIRDVHADDAVSAGELRSHDNAVADAAAARRRRRCCPAERRRCTGPLRRRWSHRIPAGMPVRAGIPSGTGTACLAATTVWVQKVPIPMAGLSRDVVPGGSHSWLGVEAGGAEVGLSQGAEAAVPAGVPARLGQRSRRRWVRSHPAPTASTIPDPSWPSR